MTNVSTFYAGAHGGAVATFHVLVDINDRHAQAEYAVLPLLIAVLAVGV